LKFQNPADWYLYQVPISGKDSAEITVLLTGAGGSASENVLDSLRRAETKYRVIGADISPVRLHLSSAIERCIVPSASNERYIPSINLACESFGVDVLHVQPDVEVRTVGANKASIDARTFLPSAEALVLAGDKANFAEAMSRANVNVPESYGVESDETIELQVEEMLSRHERVWVRARVGAGARGSLPVSTGIQARNWVQWWVTEKGLRAHDFMISEMLPGREFAFQSIWQNGTLIAGQSRERVEYLYGFLTPSGQTSTPAVARTVSDDKISSAALDSILALDAHPHGIYCVDIKESADGTPKVTEINAGRFFTTSNFFAAGGLNMPDMAMRGAMGDALTPIGLNPLDDDLYWIRMVDMNYRLVPGAELDRWVHFE
jgi:hypothetical protein